VLRLDGALESSRSDFLWTEPRGKGSAQSLQSAVKPPHSQSGQLTGQLGNFLVKNFQDRETAYRAHMWIVDQTLFRQTYQSVAPSKWREIRVRPCPITPRNNGKPRSRGGCVLLPVRVRVRAA
jgi:hypothetical protein